MSSRPAFALLASLSLAATLAAQTTVPTTPADLAATINAMVAEPAVSHAHWGVMVTTMDGAPIFALNEGQFFQPASNAKLFTTAAALALIPESTFETKIDGKGHFDGPGTLNGDLVLIGGGDANLSGRLLPYAPASASAPPLRYLEQMADAVAKSGLKRVNGDVLGDDTLFPWQPYATDWAIDDAVWGYGAPVSALTLNDNQIKLTITPSAMVGYPPRVNFDPDIPYYPVDASGLTTGERKSTSHVEIDRPIGSRTVRIYGTLALDAPPYQEELAIEDPAEYAAIALKNMLWKRGIVVTGTARAKHRDLSTTDGFLQASQEPIPAMVSAGSAHFGRASAAGACFDCAPGLDERRLASHTSGVLADDVTITNKESQNLHAELLLHQLGVVIGNDGSTAQGARVIRQFLINAGIDKDDFVFYDASGLSGHDLVTPRAIAKLLQFASTQPWFATYKSSLPIGGVDGSLESRFTKPPLKGHVFAKTGTLGEARALSGYLECASGRTVIFSILVSSHAPGTHADREVIDRIVAAIATAN
jgi:D-alanyl-D-alanine carboxypeptidase/D-alanyl-D-alanine-endopeptidase (penicillin-binding protein 4)